MRHDDSVYLRHMLETARRAGALGGDDRDRFLADEAKQLALVHLIQVLGEAARRVSVETRALHPAIPWNQIIGMRHRVVHDYLAVDLDIVWAVVSTDLPDLITALQAAAPGSPS